MLDSRFYGNDKLKVLDPDFRRDGLNGHGFFATLRMTEQESEIATPPSREVKDGSQ